MRIYLYSLLAATGLALVCIAVMAIGRSFGGYWGSVVGIVLVAVPVCAFSIYAVRRIEGSRQ